MDIWAKQDELDLNAVVITIVGNDRRATATLSGHLRHGEHGHFVIKHEHTVEWNEDQVSPFDWLRDALTALIESV